MNILFVIECNLGTVSYGDEQRTQLLYEALSAKGTVYVLQWGPREERIADRHWLISPRRQRGFKRLVNGLWLFLVQRVCPKGQARYYPFPLLPGIDHYYPAVRFDAVVVRHIDFANKLHLWNVAPLFVDVDDHPLEVFKTRFLPAVPRWRRAGALVMQNFFIWVGLRHARGMWVANPAHVPLAPRRIRVAVLPNIPFSLPEAPKEAGRKAYVFTVGHMAYMPNYEGVDRFLKSVWPRVHAAFPSLEYVVVGKGIPEDHARVWAAIPGVVLRGFVPDLSDLYAHALATVVPIDVGSGTCIKVLESLAYSRLCLSTEFGARGIPSDDLASARCGVFIYRDASEFLSLIDRVVNDAAWRESHERLAREYVASRYTREHFAEQVQAVLSS